MDLHIIYFAQKAFQLKLVNPVFYDMILNYKVYRWKNVNFYHAVS